MFSLWTKSFGNLFAPVFHTYSALCGFTRNSRKCGNPQKSTNFNRSNFIECFFLKILSACSVTAMYRVYRFGQMFHGVDRVSTRNRFSLRNIVSSLLLSRNFSLIRHHVFRQSLTNLRRTF